VTAANHYIGADQHPSADLSRAGSKPMQRPEPIVCADAVAYVLFERPELKRQQAFLEDFGMRVAEATERALYFRGHGTSPWFYCAVRGDKARFLGAGYGVKTRDELEIISNETGVGIDDCDGPGGGARVRLKDPDGLIVDIVHGRVAVERIKCRSEAFIANTPGQKSRLNAGVRSTAEPSPLEKLGHMVLAVSDFEASSQWYMRHLGVIPSDVQCVADGTPALAFCRLNRGSEPADHHTVVFVQHFAPGVMHTAYETTDLDSVGQGAQHLKLKGWTHFWGIGRHVLGSQIFDYWLDPYGDELEHYADGDVFTADNPTAYHLLDRGSLWSWGDDLPPMPKPGLMTLLRLILSGKAQSLPPVMKQMRHALAYKARPWLD
jgi:catechol 2,3-dioxygenase-like lactoylglutathione lyase family enzyme